MNDKVDRRLPVRIRRVDFSCYTNELDMLKIIRWYADNINWRLDDPGYMNRIPPEAFITMCRNCYAKYYQSYKKKIGKSTNRTVKN